MKRLFLSFIFFVRVFSLTKKRVGSNERRSVGENAGNIANNGDINKDNQHEDNSEINTKYGTSADENKPYDYYSQRLSTFCNYREFTLGKCIAVIISFLGILYTINQNYLIQYNNNPLYPFLPFCFKKSKVKSIEEFIVSDPNSGNKYFENEKTTYIFALDTSGSVTLKYPKLLWYNNTIDELNKRIVKPQNFFKKQYNPTFFEINKIRLIKLLMEIDVEPNANFAIWKFSAYAERLYPKHEVRQYADVSFKNIMDAIFEISNLKPQGRSTDFVELFEKVQSELDIRHTFGGNLVNLIILSDLIHDPIQVKHANKGLEETIRDFSKSDFINIVLFSEKEDIRGRLQSKNLYESKTQVFSYLREFFTDNRLKTITISEKISNFFIDRPKTQGSINFYYQNPNYINTSFIIGTEEFGDYLLGITSMGGENKEASFVIKYEILSFDDTIKKGNIYMGSLRPGDEMVRLPPLREHEKILLRFTGTISDGFVLPKLKIYSPRLRKKIILPMKFIREIPPQTVVFFYMAIFFPLVAYRVLKNVNRKKRDDG